MLAVGSSPATVSAFDVATGERLAQWNLTMDVRNAVHGLEVWPYPVSDLLPASAHRDRSAEIRQRAAAL